MATEVQVTFDCADPASLVKFWCEVLGYEPQSPPEGYGTWDAYFDEMDVPPERRNDYSAAVDPDGNGPRLFFQKVPEGKSVKNRVHLDVRAAPDASKEERMDALSRRADELIELGATRLERVEPSGMVTGFIVMQDPEGNEYCLD